MSPIHPSSTIVCPVCGSGDLTECIRIDRLPVYCNVLHDSREAAVAAPRGDIDLVFCRNCGHLFNAAFDPGRIDYSAEYENSLHYSGRFQEYAVSLAEELIERHDLRGKTVVEIACGQGDFLELLCSLGGNRGIGFDPSHEPGRSGTAGGTRVTFVQDYYSERYADTRADLICCRHALEHMPRPADFLRMLRRTIGDNSTAVFFEVPNARFTLDYLGIWDLIYEHCGYFTDTSLREVFRLSGFRVDETSTAFGGQFLALHGAPGNATEDEQPLEPPADLSPKIAEFARAYSDKVEGWRLRLGDIRRRGHRAVLWGAGSKGVSFVNTLKIGEELDCLVDLNPHKHSRYIPGTGHQVRSPSALTEIRPDLVIVMNPLYADEIGRDLHGMGIQAQILVDETK